MNTILTGDRPTGKLHIGHYVGSLRERVKLQNESEYDQMLIMIADTQALTDNYGNVQKVRDNVIEVMLDYLSVGLDPKKTIFFVQSDIRALPELTMYYMNLVTVARLERARLFKNAIFWNKILEGKERNKWHFEALKKLCKQDIVFLDPDNGLEVKSTNEEAIKLYESLGFTKYNERKNYYSEGEDALNYILLI